MSGEQFRYLSGRLLCANVMREPGFGETFKCVPFHTDKTSTLHADENSISSLRSRPSEDIVYIGDIMQA